ncbi:MAG: hypothetical protein WKF96_24760, partial [Solirubrobacteraceae bacterium]
STRRVPSWDGSIPHRAHQQFALAADTPNPVSGWRSINRTRSTENLAVEMHGSSAATVTWKDGDGRPDRKVHFEESLAG